MGFTPSKENPYSDRASNYTGLVFEVSKKDMSYTLSGQFTLTLLVFC